MTRLDFRAIETAALQDRPFPGGGQEFRIFISEEAFDRAVERGGADMAREVGGVLVGEVLRDASGPYLRVDATIDALHAEEKGAELTFTHATWEHVHREMDTRHSKKKIVGWYHTHPGFGIFLSDRDCFIHQSFFNLPFQVALVYDPKSREHGVFAWRDGQPWRCRRYWLGRHEEVWDGPRTGPPQDFPSPAESAPEGSMTDQAERKPRDGENIDLISVALVGLAILVVGALLGWWFGARWGTGARVAGDAAPLSADLAAARALNVELLGLVRRVVEDESTRRSLDPAIAALEEAVGGPPRQPDPAKLEKKSREALDRLKEMRTDRTNALQLLARMEESGRREVIDPLLKEVGLHRTALGQLYAELARDALRVDPARARRLLSAAAWIDPGNLAQYEGVLRGLDKDGKLPPPPPGDGAAKGAAPQEPRQGGAK